MFRHPLSHLLKENLQKETRKIVDHRPLLKAYVEPNLKPNLHCHYFDITKSKSLLWYTLKNLGIPGTSVCASVA